MAIGRVSLSLSDVLSLLARASLGCTTLRQSCYPGLHLDSHHNGEVKLGSTVHIYPTDLELSLGLKAVRLEADEADERFQQSRDPSE